VSDAAAGPRSMASGERGFTLIELMISLVLFAFAIAGVLAVAVSMSQGMREQRAAVGAENSARIPLDYIADALRQASPGVPIGTTLNSVTSTMVNGNIGDTLACTYGALTVTNNFGGAGWDQLDVIYAAGAVVTSLRLAIPAGVWAGGGTYDVLDGSQLAVNDSVVISNLAGTAYLFQISGKPTVNQITLAPSSCSFNLPSGFPVGSLVIRAVHATFSIGTVDGIPCLMMDPDGPGPATPQLFAEGIEDMQIALGYDVGTGTSCNGAAGSDGIVCETQPPAAANDDEWQGNYPGDSSLLVNGNSLRAVRVTLIARTTSAQVGNTSPFLRPAVEDHAAAGAPDKYRRRILRTIVDMRNFNGSP